jgi:hypothetical protein
MMSGVEFRLVTQKPPSVRRTSAFQWKVTSVGNPEKGHQLKRWVVSLQLNDAFRG